MSKLFIPGREVLSDELTFAPGLVDGRVVQAIETGVRRDSEGPVQLAESGNIVLLEFEGGIQQWIRKDELDDHLGVEERRDGGEKVLSLYRRGNDGRRGIGKWILKGLRVFNIDPVGFVAEKLAKKVDSAMCKDPGLYEGAPLDGEFSPAPSELPSDHPLLLFIHGTASNSRAGFAGLVEPEQRASWQALCQRYNRKPLFFEHPTLSQSPLENALELAKALPKGARLHLVTHSRGGLIGDALCLGRLSKESLPTDDVPHLRALLAELSRKRIRVEKYVRAGCPARGTILASKRLDLYLNILTNLARRTFGMNDPFTATLRSFLLAVIARRDDPERVPGIEAMIPTSPVVRLLNAVRDPLDAELTVLAGDIEGAGFGGNLKAFFTDAFYLQDHDLVVDTKSMYGGLRRSKSQFYFRSGSDVDHFNYFRRKDFVDALRRGLGDSSAAPVSFRQISTERRGFFRKELSKPTGKRPSLFILPGLMGSHLHKEGSRIWLNYLRLGIGGFRALAGDGVVDAPEVVYSAYGKLAESFDGDYDVHVWPYDWRLSIRQNAKRLAVDLDRVLKNSSTGAHPVRIVAHSMGGLVVRAMLAQNREVWEKASERRGSRILFLGTPNLGSLQILQVLSGQEGIVKGLYAVDLFGSREDYTDILAGFDGISQLLPPPHAGSLDFTDQQLWQSIKSAEPHLSIPDEAVLEEARSTWELLSGEESWDHPNMYYVAGWARATPKEIKISADGVKVIVSSRGDGRVLWEGGTLQDESHNYYARVSHGKLPDFEDAFGGYRELLEVGKTSHPLLAERPFTRRGQEEEWEEAPQPLPILPDESDLLALALGEQIEPLPPSPADGVRLRVKVVHGDLLYANHSVMLGHYEGDTIVGSEKALDNRVGGVLRARHQKDSYPGPIGSHLAYLDDSPERGALIVGLGQVGSLSAGALAATVEQGIKEFSFRIAEHGAGASRPLGLSTILIGSGDSGIPLEDALTSLVEGVLAANKALNDKTLVELQPVQELEIIELYEDSAIEAAHLLRSMSTQPRFRGSLEVEPLLKSSRGKQHRAYSFSDEKWWRRIQIVEKGGYLSYNTFLNRARAESYDLKVRRQTVQGFVSGVETDHNYSPEISSTLFELLVPNEVKVFASDRHNLMLLLDSHSATLPWEMLRDRREKEGEPLCVRAGMVRQLSTGEFRPKVDYPNSSDVLVISDPPTHLRPLPGARMEGQIVADAFRARTFDVTELIGRPVSQTLPALMNRDYKVLHFSGHGEYDPQAESALGMVIGPHFYLDPATINQMRSVPEFVFLNCCYLGNMAGSQNRGPLAANLAEQFIRMGVRAVIAAGWAVADDAANFFAQEFYTSLLAGQKFGMAVLQARKATFNSYSFDTTWGAFQAYGDPDYRLVLRGAAQATVHEKKSYVSPSEPIVECQNLAEGAEVASSEDLKWRRREFEAIEASIPDDWKNDSDLLTALGIAASELTGALHGFTGDDPFHRKAIKYFDDALNCPRVTLTLEKANLLEGIRLREAFFTHDEEKAIRIIKAAKDRRILLAEYMNSGRIGVDGTNDRKSAIAQSRVGGAYFQLAQLTDYNRNLVLMREAYLKANEISLQNNDRVDPYCLHYALAAELALHIRGSKAKELKDFDEGEFKSQLKECEEIGAHMYALDRGIFNAMVKPRGELLLALLEGNLEERSGQIVDGFEKAFFDGGTPYKFRSVLEFLYFFERVHVEKETVEVIEGMREQLVEVVR